MWEDYFLRFDSEKECNDSLSNVQCSETFDLDILGDLSTQEIQVHGWHVNVRCKGSLPEELTNFTIHKPDFPKRVFA